MDTRTLFQVMVVLQAIGALALWFNWRRNRSVEGAGWWAMGGALSVVGVGLVALRDAAPGFFSIILGNLALAGAQAAALFGHHRFVGTRPPITVTLALLAGLGAAFAWCTYVEPSLAARIVVASSVAVLFCLMILRALWPLLRAEGYQVVTLLFAVTAAHLAISLWRAITTLYAEPAISGLFSPSLIQPLFYYVMIAYCIGTIYSVILLSAERTLRTHAELAGLDGLTGLLNRRAFEQRARGEIAAAARHGRPLSLLLIDVDRLKDVNGTSGRAAGDAVLVRVAMRGRGYLRVNDAFARIGDDVFAVLLADTDLAAALPIAERIRTAVAAVPASPGDATTAATVSIGIAQLLSNAQDLDTLMRAADAALYAAKAAGRNRVASAEDPPRLVPA
jgi:diguanylate cyclase (GGDEF)-like protein